MSDVFNENYQAKIAKDGSDPVYGQAWNEGVDAFKSGAAFESNPYPKKELNLDGWGASRKYLGWCDGYCHGQYLK